MPLSGVSGLRPMVVFTSLFEIDCKKIYEIFFSKIQILFLLVQSWSGEGFRQKKLDFRKKKSLIFLQSLSNNDVNTTIGRSPRKHTIAAKPLEASGEAASI